jgi:hypothetical protein
MRYRLSSCNDFVDKLSSRAFRLRQGTRFRLLVLKFAPLATRRVSNSITLVMKKREDLIRGRSVSFSIQIEAAHSWDRVFRFEVVSFPLLSGRFQSEHGHVSGFDSMTE